MFEKYKFLLLLFYLHSIYGEYLTVTKFSDQYDPSWESLDKRPLPKWYDEAKVGIFIHWGVYAVPSFGTEWFWTNWKDAKVPSYVEFMEKNYKPGFTYQDFAVDFTAELFNSTEWALLFEKSGAKYVVITSKHHEGYALWPSKYSYSWNSVDVGPHRDILNELSTAIRQKTKMKFGVYYSLFEWFNRLYLDDKSNNFKKHDFVQLKIWPEIKELVETYHPEVLWSDGDWEAIYKYWKSEELLAWLYNESPVKETIVTNDRWGIGTLCEHGDFYTCSDRYNPGVLVSHKWENAFTIDRKSWGNRGNAKFEDFLTTYEVIKELVTTISCGGNVLVNVGPTKAGTIEPIFVERLLEMGNWLKVNGEAIYSSTPWEYQNDTITPDIWYTASKTTYPMNVFATVLKYPLVTNTIAMFAFGNVNQQIENVTLLGFSGSIAWQRSGSTLVIVFPSKNEVDAAGLQHGWVFKIKMGL